MFGHIRALFSLLCALYNYRCKDGETNSPVGKGGGEVNTPNTAEVLREEAKNAERLRILLMALECETLEEFVSKLKAENRK